MTSRNELDENLKEVADACKEHGRYVLFFQYPNGTPCIVTIMKNDAAMKSVQRALVQLPPTLGTNGRKAASEEYRANVYRRISSADSTSREVLPPADLCGIYASANGEASFGFDSIVDIRHMSDDGSGTPDSISGFDMYFLLRKCLFDLGFVAPNETVFDLVSTG